jgi:hypothetical protein
MTFLRRVFAVLALIHGASAATVLKKSAEVSKDVAVVSQRLMKPFYRSHQVVLAAYLLKLTADVFGDLDP